MKVEGLVYWRDVLCADGVVRRIAFLRYEWYHPESGWAKWRARRAERGY